MEIIYRDESFKIMGACFEVYNVIGCGFDEPIYQECLEIEFALRSLPCLHQVKLPMTYKGRVLEKFFRPDFDCYQKIIVRDQGSIGLGQLASITSSQLPQSNGLQARTSRHFRRA